MGTAAYSQRIASSQPPRPFALGGAHVTSAQARTDRGCRFAFRVGVRRAGSRSARTRSRRRRKANFGAALRRLWQCVRCGGSGRHGRHARAPTMRAGTTRSPRAATSRMTVGPHLRKDSPTSAPGLAHIRAGTRPHPRRDSPTSAPGLAHIRAGTRPHPRRDSPASAPGLAHIRAGTRPPALCHLHSGRYGCSRLGRREDVSGGGADSGAPCPECHSAAVQSRSSLRSG